MDLILSSILFGVLGGLVRALANHDWRLAVIAGYAGTDFLEGLYKIKKKQGFEI
ncbi:MAG: hypothetical protein WAV98_03660 [Minisyncoccia bacterium]